MAASIEVQIINKILNEKSLDILIDYGVDSSYFSEFKAVIDFIINHHETYQVIPDSFTLCSKFNQFELIEVNEPNEFLMAQLFEQKLYKESVPVIQQSATLLTEDSYQATQFLLEKLEKLKDKYTLQTSKPVDIIHNTDERIEEYERRASMRGLLGISTGAEGLDKMLNGMIPEDLIIILARTNEGKSWILLFLLVNAWKQGKSVLLYSGEMSKYTVLARFDSLNEHISNSDIMLGQATQNRDKEFVNYHDYIKNLGTKETPFYVITPEDLKGNDLNVPEVERLIKTFKPDIVGIDQLSLMSDVRRGENRRIELANITKDLYKLAERYMLPILSVAQASREADKEKKKSSTTVPSLSQIADSDDIARNATRVLSLGQIDTLMKIKLIKNRYGQVGPEILMDFDFNYGWFKEIDESAQQQEGEHKDTALF